MIMKEVHSLNRISYERRSPILFLTVALVLFNLASCTKPSAEPVLKAGMLTDQPSVYDKSFNEGTYNGLLRAERELDGVAVRFLNPTGENTTAYTAAIDDLYDTGHRLIVCPGFVFEKTVYETQDRYPDCKFVTVDGAPNDGNFSAPDGPTYKTAENTVAVMFSEHEAGFLAGLAAALEIGSGKLGFVGGMELPAVVRFCEGFRQGVQYTNVTYGTDCSMEPEDIQYTDTFTNPELGQQLAAVMFDRGVKVIFGCGGRTGTGAIAEAAERRKNGQDVWAVGVDTDQYALGEYVDSEASTSSAVLTSAIKYLDTAVFEICKAVLDGTFEGGRTITFNAANNGVGLPAENPNLSAETLAKVEETLARLNTGEVLVNS